MTDRKISLSTLLGLLGGALVLALLSGWYYQHKSYVWTNDAYLDGYQIAISPDIEARITSLYVDEGDAVKKGQLLCQLDESILNTKREDAATHVTLLEQSVERQKIEMEKQRDIYLVAKQEFENEILSFIEFDKIEKDYFASIAQHKVAQANLTNGVAKLGVIEEYLRHTKIVAPRDGAISKRWVVAGDVVQVGQPLFSLTDIENIWVTANLEETKIGHLKAGDQVDIHIDAYPDRKFSGSLLVVRAAAASQFSLIPPDNATGNFTKVVQRVPVKILFDIPKTQAPLHLYPGMSAEVSVKIK
jgi:membrane fusion protein, multidrug efflux system